ncbi:MAG TPA: Re/Si-specific NAD(P)(+) transhydrogenase subunit alpha [Pseudomonadota bacterium]|nr:Re/Si-specific NAD(P)(+) transhydrogenase subunit alpha [Pseudomonadota bacterium]HNN51590.1 Re/Si-specific NAD(P)(+) transhydrogenase subunit alpha [Pseudomonadota bacterium]
MKIGIIKEIKPGERRVAATPETVGKLKKLGFDVVVESGAGEGASFRDQDYEQAGAHIEKDTAQMWGQCDIVLKVQPPDMHPQLGRHEAELLREKATLVSFLWPAKNRELIEKLATRKATVLAMDLIPRITRAQKMDALSSMANIAGYRAVIEAASFFGRFFTGQVTAAGKVPPAKVMVIGAGVAGLAAIGAARGLGAIVRAFDTRPVVREQVQSMGAEFLEVELAEDGTGEGGYAKVMSPEFIAAEMALFEKQAREVDIIITTALIPGKAAPQLILRSHVEQMRPGSVIVDLAAESGGNCEVTRPGEVINHRGVTVIGYVDLPSRLAPTASSLYGNNLVHLLTDMGGAAKWQVNQQDEVVRGALVVCDGEILGPPPKPNAPPPDQQKKPAAAVAKPVAKEAKGGHDDTSISPKAQVTALLAMAAAFLVIGLFAPPAFLAHLTVFVLACFVGWQVVWNVTPALHTPLMSVTNAISGIIILGGMLKVGGPLSAPSTLLAAVAVLLSTINIAGGFLVTSRMLKMFRK